jgi:hypothetical protein
MAAGLTLLACIAAAWMQPEVEPPYRHLELAPGIPVDGHMMQLPQQHGIVLGCYGPRYPRGFPGEWTACYWVFATGEKHDLTGTVEIDGVAYTPRVPNPSVGGRGETTWRAYSADGAQAVIPYTIPGVLSADFNGDGVPDTRDVQAFLDAWSEQRSVSD